MVGDIDVLVNKHDIFKINDLLRKKNIIVYLLGLNLEKQDMNPD